MISGHLTAASDVYSFGVVLLELLTGRRSVDKSRPHREQNLAEWARPLLKDMRKLSRIMDPRLEGQYSEEGALKAAALAYQCLSHRPKLRPTVTSIVKTLEPLKDFDDISIGTFVYTAPIGNDKENSRGDMHKEVKRENGTPRHGIRSPKSPRVSLENNLNQRQRNGLNSPLNNRYKRT